MPDTHKFISGVEPICPADLLNKARQNKPPRVAIARAGASLPMEAAHQATTQGLMHPIFVGEAKDIHHHAAQLNWDISQYRLVETTGEKQAGMIAATLCGSGEADVLMKGQLHTDVFMQSALNKDVGLRSGQKFVHLFAVFHPQGGEPIVISDAAVNVMPDMDTRKDAAHLVVKLLRVLGVKRPKVAFLSATETPIPSVPSSIEASELSHWAQQTIKGADFSGPLAVDLILSKASRDIKGLGADPVAGCANGIIVPDIVSGNTLFKAMVYLCGACSAGLVVGGKVPILLTSRADSIAARLASVALAAVWVGKD